MNLMSLSWIFVLVVVVFIHELGHFLVARWCGVRVSTFSIGFGREILGFNDSHGTRWKLGWLPLGGYVKFMDDENGASVPSRDKIANMTDSERSGSFHAKPLWQRAAVVAAGPMANFASAILMFAGTAYFLGLQTIPAVIEVLPDHPAVQAGLKNGDIVNKVTGHEIADFSELSRTIGQSPGQELVFEVTRDGQPVTIKVTPEKRTVQDGFGGWETRGIIGVKPSADRAKIPVIYPSVGSALVLGADQTWQVITTTLSYFAKLPTHPETADKIGGIATVIDVSNKIATFGFGPLVQLIALLSVSIGLLNLFPIPLLDGGHLMYYAYEAVFGRPLSDQTQEIGFRIGMTFVSLLFGLALWNDRLRIRNWLVYFAGLFS